MFLLRKWFIYENVLIIWEFFDEFFLKNDIFEYIVWYEIIVGFFFFVVFVVFFMIYKKVFKYGCCLCLLFEDKIWLG